LNSRECAEELYIHLPMKFVLFGVLPTLNVELILTEFCYSGIIWTLYNRNTIAYKKMYSLSIFIIMSCVKNIRLQCRKVFYLVI
jgi:hypothetical protein